MTFKKQSTNIARKMWLKKVKWTIILCVVIAVRLGLLLRHLVTNRKRSDWSVLLFFDDERAEFEETVCVLVKTTPLPCAF